MCLSVPVSPCFLRQDAPTPSDQWAKGTQKNDVTSLYWTESGRVSAGPNGTGPLLEWG